jgi:hypothetical protein
MAHPLVAQVRSILRRVGEFVFAPAVRPMAEMEFWEHARARVRDAYAERHAPLPEWVDRLTGLSVERVGDGAVVESSVWRRRHLGPGESFRPRESCDGHASLWVGVIHTDPDTGAITLRGASDEDNVILLRAFVNRDLEIRWELDLDPKTLDPDEVGWQP